MVIVNGITYKSIAFTVLYDELKAQRKRQTIRCLYVPSMEVGETVALVFKHSKEVKEVLGRGVITEIFPIQLKAITLEIAQRDGFDSVEACQQELMRLNNKKSLNQWAFVIRWTWKLMDEYIPLQGGSG